MKRILLCALTIISLTGVCLIPTRQNEAFGQCNAYTIQRSGCCSHHGGVCGCNQMSGRLRCCDGTTSPSCGC